MSKKQKKTLEVGDYVIYEKGEAIYEVSDIFDCGNTASLDLISRKTPYSIRSSFMIDPRKTFTEEWKGPHMELIKKDDVRYYLIEMGAL